MLWLIRRKSGKRKAKGKVEDLVLDIMTKELSQLGTSNLKKNNIFAQYVEVQ